MESLSLSKDHEDRIPDGSTFGRPKRLSGSKNRDNVYNNKQFNVGLEKIDGELEKTEDEKKLISVAQEIVTKLIKESGYKENIIDFDLERVHISSNDINQYEPNFDQIVLRKLMGTMPEQPCGYDIDMEKVIQFWKRGFLIRVIHELCHRYQLHKFVIVKYKNYEDKYLCAVANQLSSNNFTQDGKRKDLFRGLMEQYTQLATIEAIKNNKDIIERDTDINAEKLLLDAQDNDYWINYRPIIRKIENMLMEKFDINDSSVYFNNIYEVAINGKVNNKYLRAIKEEYGDDSLRVLSYLGAGVLGLGTETDLKATKLVEEFFSKEMADDERKKIKKQIEQLLGD